MRRLKGGWSLGIALLAIVGCQYKAPNNLGDDDVPPDGPPPLPDAGPCPAVSKQCFTSGDTTVLQTCDAVGEDPKIDTCAWGCVDEGTPHCGALQPAGDALAVADLAPQANDGMLLPITISTDTSFDTATGAITGLRAAGPGVISGIGFEERPGVGVFRFRSLNVDAQIDVTNSNAIAIVALESITVNDDIDLTRCNDPSCPGGFAGGNAGSPGGGGAAGGAAGAGGNDDSSGGGGGAYGGAGGLGGAGASQASPAGGAPFGEPAIPSLIGGGGGGGGTGGTGGNGGGAIQLVSNGLIRFTGQGGVNAGGCGGQSGQDQKSAGGGGAGGVVLIEAPEITLDANAVIAVNGGGGGGGDKPSEGARNGATASFSASPADGGDAGNKGGVGGAGGAGTVFTGVKGANAENGGGGGGGVGWIRLNTRTGVVTRQAATVISPVIEPSSPASISAATIE